MLFVLVAILGLSMFSFFVGRSEQSTKPSATNFLPSGLAAFAELLRQDGIEVVVDRNERPRLQPTDLVISPVVEQLRAEDEQPVVSKSTVDRLETHLSSGGRVLELRFSADFIESTNLSEEVEVQWRNDEESSQKVTLTKVIETGIGFTSDVETLTQVDAGSVSVLEVFATGNSVVAVMPNAIGVTNRFLGEIDNAEFFLEVVRRFKKPGARVVFTDATIGNFTRIGLLSTLGPWAVAAQWQFILLLLVLAFTLGRRFGPVVEDKNKQRGARQLVDTVAELLKRGKKHQYSTHVLVLNSLEQARINLRLPPHSSVETILKNAPAEFVKIYGEVVEASQSHAIGKNLFSLLRALESESKRIRNPS